MKYFLILIVVLILASCDFKSSKKYFDEATKLEEQEKYADAILLLDKAIKKEPEFIGAIINRGADKSALKNYKGAIEDYELVLGFDEGNTLAIFNIANNKKRLNNYKSAISYYNAALETKGGKYLTIDWVENPSFNNKKADFDVNTFDIIYERGLAYFELDSLNNAVQDFNSCIKNNSNIANATFYLSQTYFKANHIVEGCEYLQKAIQLGYREISPNQIKLCDKQE